MFIKSKEVLLKILNKNEKLYHACVMGLMLTLVFATPVFATQPKLVSGTVKLFKAISGWLLIIIPVGAGCVLAWHAAQKSLTEDQAVIAEKNKMMKNVIIGAAVAMTADGLVAIILAFYK